MKPRIRSAGAFLLSALLLSSQAWAAPAPKDLAASLDSYLSKSYPAAEPGAAVLVAKDGKVGAAQGLRHGQPGARRAHHPGDRVRAGVGDKAIHRRGDPHAPGARQALRAGRGHKVPARFPTQGKKVTLHNLLTHTSGIPSYTGMKEWMPRMREDMPVEGLIGFFKDKPFDFEPGTQWKYNNSGYVLLGAVIEKVSGKSYERFVEDEIFQPLGMTHSSYGSSSEVVPHRAAGYDKENDHFADTPYISMTQPYAAGSLMSTVDDLALWDRALSYGTLLNKASMDQMLTSGTLTSGQLTRYGYGWTLHDLAGKKVVEHGGDINGFSCDVLRIPEEKILVVVLTNNTEAALRPDAVASRIAASLLGQPLAEGPQVRLDAKALDEYTGAYRNSDGVGYVSRDGDKLFAQRQGGTRRSGPWATTPSSIRWPTPGSASPATPRARSRAPSSTTTTAPCSRKRCARTSRCRATRKPCRWIRQSSPPTPAPTR